MTVNSYRNGATFIYDNNGDLILAFQPNENGRYELNVYDYEILAKTNVYSRRNGQLNFTSIKND